MSSAMAATCRGDVYVMIDKDGTTKDDWANRLFTQSPGAPQPSIWLNDELPMLRELNANGLLGKLLAIDAVGNPLGDVTAAAYGGRRISQSGKRTHLEELGINITQLAEASEKNRIGYQNLPQHVRHSLDREAEKRWDSCGAAANAQPYLQDWFG